MSWRNEPPNPENEDTRTGAGFNDTHADHWGNGLLQRVMQKHFPERADTTQFTLCSALD